METCNKKDILYLNLAVMMFGIAGVIGQYVEVPSVMVALGRFICSSLILLTIAFVKKESMKLESKKDYLLSFIKAIQVGHIVQIFDNKLYIDSSPSIYNFSALQSIILFIGCAYI